MTKTERDWVAKLQAVLDKQPRTLAVCLLDTGESITVCTAADLAAEDERTEQRIERQRDFWLRAGSLAGDSGDSLRNRPVEGHCVRVKIPWRVV